VKTRSWLIVALVIFPTAQIPAAPVPTPAQQEKVVAVEHTGHFQSNKAPVQGDRSYLLLADMVAFESYFGTLPPIGKKRANPVTASTFDKSRVIAVIARADSVATFSHVEVTATKTTLTLSYQVKIGEPTTAQFATPLILAIPKDGPKEIVFMENGKEVHRIK
jgi:hypothetical protein